MCSFPLALPLMAKVIFKKAIFFNKAMTLLFWRRVMCKKILSSINQKIVVFLAQCFLILHCLQCFSTQWCHYDFLYHCNSAVNPKSKVISDFRSFGSGNLPCKMLNGSFNCKIWKFCSLFSKNHLKLSQHDSLAFLVSLSGSDVFKSHYWKVYLLNFTENLL